MLEEVDLVTVTGEMGFMIVITFCNRFFLPEPSEPWGKKGGQLPIPHQIYRISSYNALPRIIPATLIMPAVGTIFL